MLLSKKSEAIVGSITLAIDAKAKNMLAEGKDVIGFGAGEPDFGTPAHIVKAGIEALNKGITRYTPASGTVELKQAICEKFLNDNGLKYDPSCIVVSNGAKHSLFNALVAICNPGDEVILPAPYWVSYLELIKMADAVPVIVQTKEEDNFALHIEDVAAAVTSKTKAIILNTPSNPTGSIYTKDQLEQVAKLAVEKDFIVISDEIYESLIYDGEQHVSIATFGEEIKERTIIVNGLSKSCAMTGWRIGYTASNKKIATIMGNYQSHATSNPNSIAQYASIAALRGSKEELNKMVEEFSNRRKVMVDKVNSIEGLHANMPKGAFYVFVNISGIFDKFCGDVVIDSAMTFTEQLLEKQLTAVVPGEAFGTKDYIRLSYATSMQNIEKGLDRIKSFVSSLK